MNLLLFYPLLILENATDDDYLCLLSGFTLVGGNGRHLVFQPSTKLTCKQACMKLVSKSRWRPVSRDSFENGCRGEKDEIALYLNDGIKCCATWKKLPFLFLVLNSTCTTSLRWWFPLLVFFCILYFCCVL